MSASLAVAYAPVVGPDVTAYRAPDPEPPYDDLPATTGAAFGRAPALGPVPHIRLAATLRAVPEVIDIRAMFDRVRTPRAELEEPAPRATVLARAILETLAGDRPVGQLARWLTPEVLDLLDPLVAAQRLRPWAATLRTVHVSEPTPGTAEVTAVIERGPRTGALALRLEGIDGRWLVTALELG